MQASSQFRSHQVVFRPARREVDRGPNRRESTRLLSNCLGDDVVTHIAASSRDTRGHARRLRYAQPAHQGLIDGLLLKVVLVLMLTTSILGPVLTERFTPRILADLRPAKAA